MQGLAKHDLDFILDATEGLWEDFREERLFLTGGTGFFGRWLLESFVAANRQFGLNASVMVLTRSPEKFKQTCPHLADDAAIEMLPGNMRDFRFPDGDFRFVIHAAADVSAARGQGGLQDNSLLAATFDGTRRTLDFAASHRTRRYLMVSSGAVYGPQPSSLSHIPESYSGAPDTCLPGSAYGEGKRASEALCASYASAGSLECPIARPFAFIGPYLPLDKGFAIGDFVRSAMAGSPIEIRSDGTALRSYLYAADLAVWLWTMLMKAPSLVPINVGSNAAISIRDLAAEVVDLLSPGLPVHVAGVVQPDIPRAQYVPDVSKAEQLLGLRQTVSLRDAIRRTASWHGWKASDIHPQPQGAFS